MAALFHKILFNFHTKSVSQAHTFLSFLVFVLDLDKKNLKGCQIKAISTFELILFENKWAVK